ncbi:TIGR04372 family glycosyltransferase [Thalassobaculum sp.]|uniref:TIGR04372 family glycosyltransferase n=1 Tax=Thalassobaculum sp. TaxID=2022740 RepID=UPI0032ECD789
MPDPGKSSPAAQPITAETLNRLATLVIPHLTPGEPVLVYVLHQWRRIGHLTIEPQILSTLYGERYQKIVIVTGNLDLPGSNRAVAQCLDSRITVVETDWRDVLALGTVDGGLIDLRHLHLLAMSARSLIVAFWRAVVAGRRPRELHLPDSLRERAHDRLAARGIDPTAPFALFHTRTMQYLPGETHHGHRTASIGRYEPSIRRILDAGYQVLRIGEPGLEAWERSPDGYLSVADAFPDDRWIDLFACAECAFATAQNSGPIWVVAAFGRPSLRTNTPLEHLNLPYNDDLSMFKHYRRVGDDRHMTYSEILDARLPGVFRDADFAERGIELAENTADEIDAATAEMLAKMRGEWSANVGRHERFRALGKAYEEAIQTEEWFVAEDLAFYGYGHPFGWIADATLKDDRFLE